MMFQNKTMAINNIMYERTRQDQKWGEQNHRPEIWLMILGEEVGEANKAALEATVSGDYPTYLKYRDEMVHVAAVALAALEAFDRDVWRGSGGLNKGG